MAPRRVSGRFRHPDGRQELDAFYRKIFMPLVRRATWKHRLLREDARDIVQDAFVLALARLEKSGNPRAWLIQVARSSAINYRRKVLRRANLTERWRGWAEPGANGRSDAENDSDV